MPPKINKQGSGAKEGNSPLDGKSAATEEQKIAELSGEGLNENNFDVVQSPQVRRGGTLDSSSKDKPSKNQVAMVPQEQYDALKARFIENETAT